MLDWWFELPLWLRYLLAGGICAVSAIVFIQGEGGSRVAAFGMAGGFALLVFADAGGGHRY